MIRRLQLDPSKPEHRRHYELGHIMLLTAALKLSRAEENRLGDLQDEWEEKGMKNEDERVVGSGEFQAFRYVLAEGAKPVEFYLEDASYDLLKRLLEEGGVSGHVIRAKKALASFVESAEKGKLVDGVFSPSEKPLKAEKREDRVLPMSARKKAAPGAPTA